MRPPSPAELILASGVGFILAGDAWITRARARRPDLDLVTDVLRRRPVLAAELYTLAHVVDVLGPFDLFRLAGRILTTRSKRCTRSSPG